MTKDKPTKAKSIDRCNSHKDRYDIPWQIIKMRDVPKALEVYYAVLLMRQDENIVSCSLNDLFDTLGLDRSDRHPERLKRIAQAVNALRAAGLFTEAPDFEHMKYKRRDQKHTYVIADAGIFENVYPFHNFIAYKSQIKKMLLGCEKVSPFAKRTSRSMRAFVFSYLYARIFSYKNNVLITNTLRLAKEANVSYSEFHGCVKELEAEKLVVRKANKFKRNDKFYVITYFTFPWGNAASRMENTKTAYTLRLCLERAENLNLEKGTQD